MKRFVVAFLAVYIFIFFWGWLLNGVLLKDIYAQTSTLWRSQREMMSLFHWIIIGQALCFFAGANSIFFGDKLLTAKNPGVDLDLSLLRELGLDIESTDRRHAAAALV